ASPVFPYTTLFRSRDRGGPLGVTWCRSWGRPHADPRDTPVRIRPRPHARLVPPTRVAQGWPSQTGRRQPLPPGCAATLLLHLPEPAAHSRPVDTGPLRGLDLAHAALDGLDGQPAQSFTPEPRGFQVDAVCDGDVRRCQ